MKLNQATNQVAWFYLSFCLLGSGMISLVLIRISGRLTFLCKGDVGMSHGCGS